MHLSPRAPTTWPARSGTAAPSRATWACAGTHRRSWLPLNAGAPHCARARPRHSRRRRKLSAPTTRLHLPHDTGGWADEARLAGLAATVAIRRHARGRDMRRVRLLVGSGGVLRHQPAAAAAILAGVLNDHAGGWALPRTASVVVDTDYVLRRPAFSRARIRSRLTCFSHH